MKIILTEKEVEQAIKDFVKKQVHSDTRIVDLTVKLDPEVDIFNACSIIIEPVLSEKVIPTGPIPRKMGMEKGS